MDQLEERGYVGKEAGSSARQVLRPDALDGAIGSAYDEDEG
jgi:hypothetical protein